MTRTLGLSLLLLLVGCGRSILILPGVGEDGSDSGTEEYSGMSTLTIGDESDGMTAICGDGLAEADELCDGADLAGWTCADLGFDGGELVCTGSCTLDATGCDSGSTTTSDPGTTGPGTTTTGPGDGDGDGDSCGDGVIDPGEECDGADFGGINCVDLGFGPGLPLCIDCLFDTSTCPPPDPIEGEPCGWNQPCPNGYACVSGTCYDGSPGDPCDSDMDCLSGDCTTMGMWGGGTCN